MKSYLIRNSFTIFWIFFISFKKTQFMKRKDEVVKRQSLEEGISFGNRPSCSRCCVMNTPRQLQLWCFTIDFFHCQTVRGKWTQLNGLSGLGFMVTGRKLDLYIINLRVVLHRLLRLDQCWCCLLTWYLIYTFHFFGAFFTVEETVLSR